MSTSDAQKLNEGPVETTPAIVLPQPGTTANSATGAPVTDVVVTPTQVRRPWRSTTRTIFQALIGFAVILPIMVQVAGLDPAKLPWLAGVLAVAAAATRLMAVPAVEEWLRRFLPFLAAAPSPAAEHRKGDSAKPYDETH